MSALKARIYAYKLHAFALHSKERNKLLTKVENKLNRYYFNSIRHSHSPQSLEL
jgi:hypothetical protein